MDTNWIVARTRPCHERKAATNIERQGHQFYLPYFFDEQSQRRKPLFASYIFVLITGMQFGFLRGTYGIRSILTTGEQPSIIAPKVIDALRSREANGLVQVPKLHFAIGDKVRLLAGHFADHIGIYQGMDNAQRVTVLLSLFNQPTKVSVQRSLIERALPIPAAA